MKGSWKLGIVIAAMLISSAAPAHGQAGMAFRGLDSCAQDLIQAVGLSAAQQAALETLRQQTLDAIKPILQQSLALRQQIDTASASADPDACAIGNLEIQAHGLGSQVKTIEKNAEATFVASLSASQQVKYTAFVSANPECAAFPSRRPRMWMAAPPA